MDRGAVVGGLGDVAAGGGAVEAPAVVDALQPAPGVDAALGEGGEAVGAAVVEHPPGAGGAVPPDDEVEAEDALRVRGAGVEVADGGDGVPFGVPVEGLGDGRGGGGRGWDGGGVGVEFEGELGAFWGFCGGVGNGGEGGGEER